MRDIPSVLHRCVITNEIFCSNFLRSVHWPVHFRRGSDIRYSIFLHLYMRNHTSIKRFMFLHILWQIYICTYMDRWTHDVQHICKINKCKSIYRFYVGTWPFICMWLTLYPSIRWRLPNTGQGLGPGAPGLWSWFVWRYQTTTKATITATKAAVIKANWVFKTKKARIKVTKTTWVLLLIINIILV